MGRALSREEECERILQHLGPDAFERISLALERQFTTLHNRAQLLLGICGVLISASVLVTTGKIIGRPEFLYQHWAGRLLVLASGLQIGAAAVVVGGVLSLRWITQQPGEDLRTWVLSNLEYRDQKLRLYRLGTWLLLFSMMAYQGAIAIALFQL